jgi:hypothetical protein
LLCDGFADAKYSIVSYSVSEKTWRVDNTTQQAGHLLIVLQ